MQASKPWALCVAPWKTCLTESKPPVLARRKLSKDGWVAILRGGGLPYYHPISWCRSGKKRSGRTGFVNISACWSSVRTYWISISLLSTNRRKWWYFNAMCLVLGVNFCVVAIAIHDWLSSHTLHRNVGGVIRSGNSAWSSFNNVMRGITSRRAVERAIYSASAVLSAISVWSLLDQKIGQFAYLITNPVLE